MSVASTVVPRDAAAVLASGLTTETSRPAAGAPPGRSDGALGYLWVGLAASLWVAVFALRGESLANLWDGAHYLKMARGTYEDIPAPYVYRPATPLIVRGISLCFGLPADVAFLLLTAAAAVGLLVAGYALARAFGTTRWSRVLPVVVIAGSAAHVKLPLFLFTTVDVPGYALTVIALLAFARARYGLAFAVAAVGVFFKEFLVIPLVLVLVKLGRDYLADRSRRAGRLLALGVLATAATLMLPHLLFPVTRSEQQIDPWNAPATLVRLGLDLFDEARLFNVIYSVTAYWLPTLMLLSRARAAALWERLGCLRVYWAIAFLLHLAMVLYAGDNTLMFTGYFVALQVIVLAILASTGLRVTEMLLVLLALVMVNRLPLPIPHPSRGVMPYLDFLGGWAPRVSPVSLLRMLTVVSFIAAAGLLRMLALRDKPVPGAQSPP